VICVNAGWPDRPGRPCPGFYLADTPICLFATGWSG
jgi:hypothetical protein